MIIKALHKGKKIKLQFAGEPLHGVPFVVSRGMVRNSGGEELVGKLFMLNKLPRDNKYDYELIRIKRHCE